MTYHQLFNGPLICFLIGIFASILKPTINLSEKTNKFLTFYILFSVGIKGGVSLAEQATSSILFFAIIILALISWGFLQPFFSFYLLKRFTLIDSMTAAAIAACFGSVSVMTFVSAISFLEELQVPYQKLIIAALAIMEIPAILSGIFLAHKSNQFASKPCSGLRHIIQKCLFNKAVIGIAGGLMVGFICSYAGYASIHHALVSPFKPLLCLFLFDMGLRVGHHRSQFQAFSWPLVLFGIYMPIVGAVFGIWLSYVLSLDAGTGMLISVLAASASYIAVPAAMRIALPQAKEAIYLPLSLGITFPFNVMVGVPAYHYFASKVLA